ncbi:MAG: GAF domain-containing protein [Desulfuromonadales bacterium]|nr:MAG: GAF domain-containing protein [Desulfuromonadales bacterium]
MDEQPLYNSRIIDTYLKLLRKRYASVDVEDLLRYAGMTIHEVMDPGHWFTQKQVDRFYARLVQLSGNETLAREAGRFAASPEALGALRAYLLGLVGPRQGFRLVNRAAAMFTRSSDYESRPLAANRVEVVVRFREGVAEKPFQCANRMGFLEAFVSLFTDTLPAIEHSECIFRGGRVCRYELSWERRASDLWRGIRPVAALLLSGLCAVLGVFSPETLGAAIPAAAALFLAIACLAERAENRELHSALVNLRDSTDRLLGDVQSNYNQALLVNEIGQVISSKTDVDTILAFVAQLLEKRLVYDRGVIMLADVGRTTLTLRAGYGYGEEERSLFDGAAFPLNGTDPPGILVRSFREQKPLHVTDIDDATALTPQPNRELARALGGSSFICCPIVCEGESLGVLAVDNIRTNRPLLQSDLSLLGGIAQVIGVSIHNAMLLAQEKRLVEQLRRQTAELEASNRELESFSYSVAHDLSAPVRTIKGYCSVIEEDYAHTLDHDLRAHLSRIEAAAARMTGVIDDLLKLSCVARSELIFETVDLSGLAREIAEEMTQRDPQRIMEFRIADGVHCQGDPRLLRIALDNLIRNAWKFTAPRRKGVIEFEIVERDGIRTYCVRDNGAGFDMAYAAKLFQPFQRLHRVDEFEGTGIGLAMVQRIISRHGGSIRAEGAVEQGATFFFVLDTAGRTKPL